MKSLLNSITLISILGLTACNTFVPENIQRARAIDAENAKIRATLPDPNARYSKLPRNYQEKVKLFMANDLKDPDSAKYTKFSKPRKEHVIKKKGEYITPSDVYYGYSTCVLINAKNSYGAYVGNQLYWFFFYNGEVMRSQKVERFGLGSEIYIGRKINCADGE